MPIVDDNPCPKCGKPCQLVAGINVPHGDRSKSYLVCWKCKMKKETGLTAEWGKVGKPARTAEEDESMGPVFRDWNAAKQRRKVKNLAEADPTGWHKHTDHHWSRMVGGKKLDYWPSTRKWMYEGRVMSGDLEGFIRKRGA